MRIVGSSAHLPSFSPPPLQGRLYSKQSVLEWLLARAGTFADDEALHRHMNVLRESGDAFDHITSMKCVMLR